MVFNTRLLVVIVNYRAADLVCQSLSTLLPQLLPEHDLVTVVDNDSGDGSSQVLAEYIEDNALSSQVKLINSEHNGGFSFGNNLAMRTVLDDVNKRPEFILLLNPDTRVFEGAIDELVTFMGEHPQAGILGSRLEGEDGHVQCSSFRFHSLWSELESSLRLGVFSRMLSDKKVSMPIPTQETQVDWVAGASMLIRADVLDDVGLMDETYFLYFEETDFCLQAKRQGWECWYIPQSRVLHYVGQSTGIVSGDRENRRRPKYWFDARQYYFRKNHGVFYTLMADLIWGIGFSIWRLRRVLQGKEDTDPKNMLADFLRYSLVGRFFCDR